VLRTVSRLCLYPPSAGQVTNRVLRRALVLPLLISSSPLYQASLLTGGGGSEMFDLSPVKILATEHYDTRVIGRATDLDSHMAIDTGLCSPSTS
jgi:hypothetical protein